MKGKNLSKEQFLEAFHHKHKPQKNNSQTKSLQSMYLKKQNFKKYFP